MVNKEILKRFDDEFSNSSFWVDKENYPKNYKLIKKFISKISEDIKKEVEIHCEEEYRKFIIEKNKENCDEISNLFLEIGEKYVKPKRVLK